ncbi:hypothetical protein [Embleya scabrispora]|uniref:hypothetical protein n=1 Tax=Embleya scabrispora TaxID=159449 RepID=UPI0011814FC0|nr:hypothetical protein [Embleya scabrispora]
MNEDEAWAFSIRASELLEKCTSGARRTRMRDRAILALGGRAWSLPLTLAVIAMNKCPMELRDELGHPASRLWRPAAEEMPSASVMASLLMHVIDHPRPEEAAVWVRQVLVHAAAFVDSTWEFLTDPEDREKVATAESRFRGLAAQPYGIENVTTLYLDCLDVINGSATV